MDVIKISVVNLFKLKMPDTSDDGEGKNSLASPPEHARKA